jgi:hypothetical protein
MVNIYLCEYSFDGLFKDLDLFRDVRLDGINEGVDTFHCGNEVDQLLVCSDLFSNNLHAR